MNKAHFQSMFGSTTGNVYRFAGELAQNPVADITEKFVVAAQTSVMSVVVVESNTEYVVYSDLPSEVSSSDFELLTSLTPDPIIEPTIDAPVEGV